MTGPSSALLADVAGRMADYMLDTAQVLYYTEGDPNEYGTPAITYPAGAELACSMNDNSAREVLTTAQLDTHDAVVRLPAGTVIESRDRVQIVRRLGRLVDPALVYTIDGEIERGPFGVVCPLKLYTGVDHG